MAPRVCVPADFGRHHIGAASHGNLAFNMKEGDPIKANSIILSLNSPKIDDLTTNLHLTSIDADDFSRGAVDCFIEASYTGEIEAVTLDNLRDVSKMSHVFNVSWLSDRCAGYFDDYLKDLNTESSYTDLAFAVDEAVYQLSTMKKRIFLDLIVRKFSQLSERKLKKFFKEYLSDFGDSTTYVLDCCIAIAQSFTHIIVEIFLEHLEKKELKILDAGSRALLKGVDLNLCFEGNLELHERFFTVLDQIKTLDKDDVRLILSSLKQASAPKKTASLTNVSVCLPSFKPYLDMNYDEAFKSLFNNECITDLYMLFDAMWTWLTQKEKLKGVAAADLLEKIVEKQKQKNWKRMSAEYVKTILSDGWGDGLKELVSNCEQLVSHDDNIQNMAVICEFPRDRFVKEVFRKNKFFRFTLPNTSPANQEFELNITVSGDGNPNVFNLRWRRLLDNPTDTEMFPRPTLHFALRWFYHGQWEVLPISWCGKPTCDKTMECWNWGYIEFRDQDAIEEDDMIQGSDGYVDWWDHYTLCENNFVNLICFQVD